MPNDNSAEVHPGYSLLHFTAKTGVFLACIDVLQHLRKETDLVWKTPTVFEEQTEKYMRSCPGELGLQQTLTLNSGMNIFVQVCLSVVVWGLTRR